MADYLPAEDNALKAWESNFQSTLTTLLTTIALGNAFMVNLTATSDYFAEKLTQHQTQKTLAMSKRSEKDAAKKLLVKELRLLSRQLQANPLVTEAMKLDLGITVAKSNQVVVGTPTSRPVVSIDTSNRLQHGVAFRDEGTPNSKAKPKGVTGVRIYAKIGGTAPTSSEECQFLGTDSATPYIANFSPSDAGKTVYYILRWVNRKDEVSPESQIISATIVA